MVSATEPGKRVRGKRPPDGEPVVDRALALLAVVAQQLVPGTGGSRFRLFTIHLLVSAGSITSSIPPPVTALTAFAFS